jgi:outer membrane protein assembly factor BamB
MEHRTSVQAVVIRREFAYDILMMNSPGSLRATLLLAFLSIGSLGADWAQFRGPTAGGASDVTSLPTEWSATKNIVWKTDLPGYGASGPIVVGKRIFLTCYSGYGTSAEEAGDITKLTRSVLCYQWPSASEKAPTPLWRADVPAEQPEQEYQGFAALHGYTSTTPACDGERLYVFFGTSGVRAFDLDGKPLWHVGVGTNTHNWGTGPSPVLYENLVIINANVESQELIALDKFTGAKVWSVPGVQKAWNTPLLVKTAAGKTELVLSMKQQIIGFDPATGERLWVCQGIDDYICPSPIAHGDIVYCLGARKNTAIAVKVGGRDDVTETHVLWKIDKGSNVTSPVYHDGYLYWASESKGVAYCVDAATGEVKYEERIEPRPDRIYASPIVAGGKIYYVSRDKGTYVVAAKPEYQLLAHNVIDDDTSIFNASPAVSHGMLLLRSDRALYAIGQ